MKSTLHRDIKSSNVALDADFSPHLGDFGLVRLMEHDQLEKTTTLIAGTFGYMAPEGPTRARPLRSQMFTVLEY